MSKEQEAMMIGPNNRDKQVAEGITQSGGPKRKQSRELCFGWSFNSSTITVIITAKTASVNITIRSVEVSPPAITLPDSLPSVTTFRSWRYCLLCFDDDLHNFVGCGKQWCVIDGQ